VLLLPVYHTRSLALSIASRFVFPALLVLTSCEFELCPRALTSLVSSAVAVRRSWSTAKVKRNCDLNGLGASGFLHLQFCFAVSTVLLQFWTRLTQSFQNSRARFRNNSNKAQHQRSSRSYDTSTTFIWSSNCIGPGPCFSFVGFYLYKEHT
jgi:hypothetical protein